jgi:hypothetical protein
MTSISGQTDLFVLIGDPVAHARSLALVNEALAARGRDAVLASGAAASSSRVSSRKPWLVDTPFTTGSPCSRRRSSFSSTS